MSILLLGAPGSGKTYFVKNIKPLHSETFDADYDIPGLAGWTDTNGNVAVFPKEPTIAWLETHSFNWNENILRDFLLAHPDAIVCGIAANAFELAHLFTKSYYLLVDAATLRERLLSETRKNNRGKSDEEIEQISQAITKEHLPAAQKNGVHVISGAASPIDIFMAIHAPDINKNE